MGDNYSLSFFEREKERTRQEALWGCFKREFNGNCMNFKDDRKVVNSTINFFNMNIKPDLQKFEVIVRCPSDFYYKSNTVFSLNQTYSHDIVRNNIYF